MRAGLFAVVSISGVLLFGAAPPKPLALENITLSQYEDGPPVAGSSYYAAGETVFLSFQVSGYRATGEDDPAIKLSWRVEAKDPAGIPIAEPATGRLATTLAQEDKNWMPKVRATVQVPPFGPSGTYRFTMVLQDEIAKAEVRAEKDVTVHGRDVEPSPSLALRNVHFYRGEEDPKPIGAVAYRPGDTVWIRFDIVGFKLGEQNRFEVGYGIKVLRANGDTLFEQPEAAVDRNQSFYPQRYVPAALSLNLTKDLPAGQYTVMLTANDKVGDQKCESRQAFTVEK